MKLYDKPTDNKPFLYSIAEAYVKHEPEELVDYCFVFPNKRSCVFFHQAMSQVCKSEKNRQTGLLHPATITISEFIEDHVDGKIADRLELIMNLYHAYRKVLGKDQKSGQIIEGDDKIVDFNRFLRWADMLLSDFNDVDMYMVEPEEIFPNIRQYREISSNYIEPELIEEIKRHWAMKEIPENTERFWNHIEKHYTRGSGSEEGSEDKENAQSSVVSFFHLWQMMLEVYTKFKERLNARGLLYSGMAYRQALETIKSRRREDFEYKRYVFVGFNMLSQVEKKIFHALANKRNGHSEDDFFADFYFDNASWAFPDDENQIGGMIANPAALAIEKYIKEFKSKYQRECITSIKGEQKIEIIGVASRIGQAKIIGGICKTLYPKPEEVKKDPASTAIILPQESLSQAVLTSMPDWISPLNITMGYKLRDSRAASFVHDVVTMHFRGHRSSSGGATFFYEDVIKVLTHPILQQLYPDDARALVQTINELRMYSVKEEYVKATYKNLEKIFTFVNDSGSAKEVFGYFRELFEWMLRSWDVQKAVLSDDASAASTDDDVTTDIDGERNENLMALSTSSIIDRMLTKAYLGAVERLEQLVGKYFRPSEIYLGESTMFHLLERLVGGQTINYDGRPLEGLQIMGVLEARNLDFENVIIPSMNERIFPRKQYQKSFIPPHLRAAYGMSTQEHQESIYAYYFYRMISRAKQVYLLYDTRTQGTGGGQMSRYLEQLRYIYRKTAKPIIIGYTLNPESDDIIEVKKTDAVMKELERFRSDENPRNFSASSINQYINCSLAFYLSYIAGYKRENEYHDYMDEGTFGTIIHDSFEDIFNAQIGGKPQIQRLSTESGIKITHELVDKIRSDERFLSRIIKKNINLKYNRLSADRAEITPLTGDAQIFHSLILSYIRKALERDIQVGEYEFRGAEYKRTGKLRLSPELAVNFYFSIDRVDKLYPADGSAPLMRIVDYKTGSDKTEIATIDDLFIAKDNNGRAKAILQLFLYCEALSQFDGLSEPIIPMIYPIRKVETQKFSPLLISAEKRADGSSTRTQKVAIGDFREYIPEVKERLTEILNDLFNPEIPFKAADNDHSCKFCEFKAICQRKETDY